MSGHGCNCDRSRFFFMWVIKITWIAFCSTFLVYITFVTHMNKNLNQLSTFISRPVHPSVCQHDWIHSWNGSQFVGCKIQGCWEWYPKYVAESITQSKTKNMTEPSLDWSIEWCLDSPDQGLRYHEIDLQKSVIWMYETLTRVTKLIVKRITSCMAKLWLLTQFGINL